MYFVTDSSSLVIASFLSANATIRLGTIKQRATVSVQINLEMIPESDVESKRVTVAATTKSKRICRKIFNKLLTQHLVYSRTLDFSFSHKIKLSKNISKYKPMISTKKDKYLPEFLR